MSFFPFFAMGLIFDPAAARHSAGHWPHACTAARLFLVGMLAACVLKVQTSVGNGWNPLDLGGLGDFDYDYITPHVFPERPLEAITPPACGLGRALICLCRVLRYALSSLMAATFFLAVPAGPARISEAGRHTMFPYLLHSLPL